MEIKLTLGGQLYSGTVDLVAAPAPIPAPAPAPAPTPAPTPAPAPATFQLVAQNMSEISPGVYKSNSLFASDHKCYLQARLASPVGPGQRVTVSYDQTTNVVPDGTKNIKDYRAWPASPNVYPNDYSGRGINTGNHQLTAENNDGVQLYHKASPTRWTDTFFLMPIKSGVKQHIERVVRYSSAPGKNDGYVKITVDGVIQFESDGWIVNPGRVAFGPQLVYAPISGDSGPLPADAYLQIEKLNVVVG